LEYGGKYIFLISVGKYQYLLQYKKQNQIDKNYPVLFHNETGIEKLKCEPKIGLGMLRSQHNFRKNTNYVSLSLQGKHSSPNH
jgi:hypothetical protein